MPNLETTVEQLSALAHGTRLRTFRLLMEAAEAGLPAGAIAEQLSISPNSLSNHLKILTTAQLASVSRNGRQRIYKVEIDTVKSLMSSLVENCCHGHPEVCSLLIKARTPNSHFDIR